MIHPGSMSAPTLGDWSAFRLSTPQGELLSSKQARVRAVKLTLIVAAHALALYALSRETIQQRVMNVISAQIISIESPTVVSTSVPLKTPQPTPRPVERAVSKPTMKTESPPPERPPEQSSDPIAPSRTLPAPSAPASPRADSSAPIERAPSEVASKRSESVTAAMPSNSQPSPPAAPRVELPSSTADYLNNPAPPYPPQSKRLGEKGRVLLHVWVNESGLPEKVEIKQSSGFDRLDEIALATVKRWKFVAGKKNGVAEAMWVNVPLVFELS